MAYYNYYYPQPWPPYYIPDPWRTTLVPHHFPEHHYPLEKARHAITDTISSIGHAIAHPFEEDPPVHYPRADVRESEKFYYVDVELPGVEGKEKVKLKWLSSRTLLVQAYTKRPLTGEESEGEAAERSEREEVIVTKGETGEAFATKTTDAETNGAATEAKGATDTKSAAQTHESEPNKRVFLTVKERQIGLIARAFNFPTTVDHATLTAHLQHGLLSLQVTKAVEEHVKEEHKNPEVKDGGKPDDIPTA